MKKFILLFSFTFLFFSASTYCQTGNGTIFSDKDKAEYEKVQRWMNLSQDVTVTKKVKKEIADYYLINVDKYNLSKRFEIFVKAALNEKFTIGERKEICNWMLSHYERPDSPFPFNIFRNIMKDLGSSK